VFVVKFNSHHLLSLSLCRKTRKGHTYDSNRWNSQKRWPQVESALKNAGIDFDLAVSEYPKHAQALAVTAARAGFDPILAAGGDGTLGDVLNGVMETGLSPTLGVLPVGTGNDFAHGVKIPKAINDFAQVIAKGKTEKMDVGLLNGQRYFINNCGLGLESYIGKFQENISWIKGAPRYMVAAVRGILDHPSWRAEIQWEGGSFSGNISLISVGNGIRSGGMFYMTPHAKPNDGKLTMVYGYRETSAQMLALLPYAMNAEKNTYVEKEGIYEVDTSWVKIKLNRPSPWHTDGELSPEDIDAFDFTILPARINIIVP
jgi:diacylglycerol kinase (ATP)